MWSGSRMFQFFPHHIGFCHRIVIIFVIVCILQEELYYKKGFKELQNRKFNWPSAMSICLFPEAFTLAIERIRTSQEITLPPSPRNSSLPSTHLQRIGFEDPSERACTIRYATQRSREQEFWLAETKLHKQE